MRSPRGLLSDQRTASLARRHAGDKRPGTQWGQEVCQIKSAEIASTCVNGTGIFRHDCDIYGGQSGSPVYDSNLYVQGVISFAQVREPGPAAAYDLFCACRLVTLTARTPFAPPLRHAHRRATGTARRTLLGQFGQW